MAGSSDQPLGDDIAAAFRQAEYCIWLDGRMHAFRIGETAAEALTHLQTLAGLSGAAYVVTPCNPGAHRLSMAVNRTRLASFREQLKLQGVRWMPAVNRDPTGQWPDEPGALLLDCSETDALEIAREYGQLAIVRLAPRERSELIPVN